MAGAVQQTTLFDELDRSAERMALVGDVSFELSSVLELGEVLTSTARRLCAVSGAPLCHIYTLGDGAWLESVTSIDGGEVDASWQGRRFALDEWTAIRTSDPRYDPGLWFLAWDGAEVAGGILGYDMGEISWIRELGVRPRWRGRGLGKALLIHSFAAFKARGRTKVSLGVDSQNAYDATGLYERAGMIVGQQHEFWERETTA